MVRRLAVPAAVSAALAAGAGAGAAAAQPPISIAEARLQGPYAVSGVITHAVGVPGERRGQTVSRTWTFGPTCPAGPCPAIVLIRPRAGGIDRLTLRAREPGYYVGRASFLAPMRCRHRRWRRGERVPYRITVRITAAVAQGPSVIATAFTATYYNRRRIGLTPCFTPPAHDAARYTGSLPPPPPAGSIRSVESTPPSRAS